MPTGPIVPDTSAWIEFIRGTGSVANARLRAFQQFGADLVVTGPVVMEVLAGAQREAQRSRARDLLGRCRYIAVEDPSDYEHAAALYRACRVAGQTLRGQLDCLIAAVAIRIGAAVLHADSDFDVIARHSPLRIV
ncbi:MAG TPA: PIN domain nuclease [Thermoleophilaceae bacterium]|jgi:hypothetical protein